MQFEKCYRCGQIKLASVNQTTGDKLECKDVEMVMMGWGKHHGEFRCKDCHVAPKIRAPSAGSLKAEEIGNCKIADGLCLTHGFSVSEKVQCPRSMIAKAEWDKKFGGD